MRTWPATGRLWSRLCRSFPWLVRHGRGISAAPIRPGQEEERQLAALVENLVASPECGAAVAAALASQLVPLIREVVREELAKIPAAGAG